MIKRTISGTVQTSGNTQYTIELDFCMGGYSSDELSTDTYLYNNDNRYTKHGFNIATHMRIKNSSGAYIYPSSDWLQNLSLRITFGYDVFECELAGKKVYYSENDGYYWISLYFDKDVYRAYTPGSSTRSRDSVKIEVISKNQGTYPYGVVSGTIDYPNYYQLAAPTANYAIVSEGNTLTIYTNRMNSNITHTIRYAITGANRYQIWDTTKTDYTTGNRWISGIGGDVGKTLATGVGDSYQWTIPTSGLFVNENYSDGFYDLVFQVEGFYNGVSLGTRTLVVKLFRKQKRTSEHAAFDYLQINDSGVTGTNYSRKHFVAGKSNLYFTGYGRWLPSNNYSYSNGYLWDVRYTIDGTTMFDYDVENYASRSFTTNSNKLYNTSVQEDVSWGGRYKPGIRDLPLGIEAHYTRSGSSSYSTALDSTTVDYYISPYNSPNISTLSIYRVDADDNRDSEGSYMHIKCNCATTMIGTQNNRGDGDGSSIFDINNIKLVMYYKKISDSSWSNVTLVPMKYENYIMYDQRYTGLTFDATAIYEFRFELSDKFETVSKSVTVRPPIILIDYNKSGTAMAFGKMSDAPTGASYIESIMPIIFEDTANRYTSWTGGTLGAITQTGTNSSNYFNVFVGRSSTGYRRYGLTVYDTDTASSCDMRLYTNSSYLSVAYSSMKYYSTNSSKYFQVNPTSTYCNLNTDSDYFYTNKNIYMVGNLLATQSWVNSKSYATQTWVNDKGYITMSSLSGSNYNCGIGGDTKSSLTDFSSSTGQNRMNLKVDGTTTFQIHWGRLSMGSVPSSYDGQYVLRKSCSFSTSFGKAPIVVATPVLNRNDSSHHHWKCDCTICSVSTSSFTAEVTAEGWQGSVTIMWFAIGSW